MMGKTELHELSRSIRAEQRKRAKEAAASAPRPSLTEAQTAQVRRAVDAGGILDERIANGLARAGWTRMMERLCASGIFRRYVHGGYEITDLGRAADDRVKPPVASAGG